MGRFKQYYLTEKPGDVYTGIDIEQGATSRPFKNLADGIKIAIKGYSKDSNIIDFGCGRIARNSVQLRKMGFKNVFAYDPYHGTADTNSTISKKTQRAYGWGDGEISKTLPKMFKFDMGFTSYVLNVTSQATEDLIVKDIKFAVKKGNVWHLVRNEKTLSATVKRSLTAKKNDTINKFYIDVYEPNAEEMMRYDSGALTDQDIKWYLLHGVQTRTKEFQRLITGKGMHSIKTASDWELYKQ